MITNGTSSRWAGLISTPYNAKSLALQLASRAERAKEAAPVHESEIRQLRTEVDRLTAALAGSNEKPDAIISAIAERERRLHDLERQVAVEQVERGRAQSHARAQLRSLAKLARRRLGELQRLLERNPVEARKTLEAICDGPLKFWPLTTEDGGRRLSDRWDHGGRQHLGLDRFTTVSVPDGIRTLFRQLN